MHMNDSSLSNGTVHIGHMYPPFVNAVMSADIVKHLVCMCELQAVQWVDNKVSSTSSRKHTAQSLPYIEADIVCVNVHIVWS